MQRSLSARHATVSTTSTVGDRQRAKTREQWKARERESPLTFYPAYTFKASPAWSKWVKLTCSDIHNRLKAHDKYTSVTSDSSKHAEKGNNGRTNPPLLLFYLNHPIQFIQVIGVVVAVEEYFDSFWLFTIDDSSGATINVTCRKLVEYKVEAPKQTTQVNTQKSGKVAELELNIQGQDAEPTQQTLLKTLSTLTLGTTVQAKGTLSTFRKIRQLTLLRLNALSSTSQEMTLIASRTEFISSTLSKPWVLSTKEQRKLRMEMQDDKDDEVERARKWRKKEQKKRDREERHEKVVGEDYERDEGERQRQAQKARRYGEKLKASRTDEPSERQELWLPVA